MNHPWSADFSYDYLRRLLRTAAEHFDIHPLASAPQRLDRSARRGLILRHDVDLDLNCALRMARIECAMGIQATYMMLVDCPFYDLRAPSASAVLEELLSMGHEVAVHVDVGGLGPAACTPTGHHLQNVVRRAADELARLLNRPVQSISFHRPLPQLLRGPLYVEGMVNAYAADLMVSYLSDSRGQWRDGEPLHRLLQADRWPVQMLIHPIWWGDDHRSATDTLQVFFESACKGMSLPQVQAFDAALADHLSIRRRGPAIGEEIDYAHPGSI